MKTILLSVACFIGSVIGINSQTYPITNSDGLQQLVVQPDLAQIKLLIFDDTYVHADRFIYFALMQGLAKDGMPVGIAKSVVTEAQGPNFVPKCEICKATKKAFDDYATYGDAYSTGKNPYKGLAAKDNVKRHEAIRDLIDKYTSAFITQLQLSDLELQKLQNKLASMRKQGMSGMGDGFGSKFCPSCDGVTHTRD